MPVYASLSSRDKEARRLTAQLEKYRTGNLDAAGLASYLRSLDRRTKGVLPLLARDLFVETAKKLDRGSYKVRGGKLTGNLLHLERTLTHFWGKTKPPTLLGVSEVLGGPPSEYSEARAVINDFYRMTQEVRPSPRSGDLRIAFVFHLPGSLIAPGFEGIRTSSFLRSERIKAIQVAVPSDLDASHMRQWLAGTLIEAIDLIQRRVKRRYAPLSTEAVEQVIAALASKLASGVPGHGR